VHSVRRFVLDENLQATERVRRVRPASSYLIVFTESNDEDDGRDVLEAMNPFLALGPLAADVEHAEVQI
jgi:hypothetical protein